MTACLPAALMFLSLSAVPASCSGQQDDPRAKTANGGDPVLRDGIIISSVEFTGLRRISSDSVRAHIATRVGQPLDRLQIQQDVRALDRLGWFDSIAARVRPVADSAGTDGFDFREDSSSDRASAGARLIFVLQERPFLAGVEFRGSRLLSRERIDAILAERRIALKLAAPASRADLWRAARAIEAELAALGHPRAQVRVRLAVTSIAAVRASFQIQDGAHVRAGRVTFTGNREFSDENLRRQMKRVAPQALFVALRGKDVYTPQRLAEDLDHLTDYYRNHGYADARVGTPAVETRQDSALRWLPWPHRYAELRWHVSVPVREGNLFRWATVQVQSEAAIAKPRQRLESLPAVRALRPGEPYSQQGLEYAREALGHVRVAQSSKEGALPAEVGVTPQFDPVAGTASVTFHLRQPQPYIVRCIEFSGQRRLSDQYYRRRVLLKEGQPFDPSRLETGLAQLARTGYVKPAKKEDVHVQFDERRRVVDIAIHVEEIGRQKISLVGGRGGVGNTLGIVYNLFDLLGGEELITAHLEGGPESWQVLLSIAKEGLFGTRASLGFSVFQNIVRPNLPTALGGKLFASRRSGLVLGWTYPVTQTDGLGVNYERSHSSTQYNIVLPPTISGLPDNALRASTTTRSLGVTWARDAGSERFDAGASVSGGWLGGNENLLRSSVEYARLQADPWSERRNAWALRSYVAGVGGFRGDLPFHSRYFAADELVRGFREGELSPYAAVKSIGINDAGNLRAQPTGSTLTGAVNAEYRVPLLAGTEAAAFFDAGSGWLLPNWLGPSRPELLAGTNGVLRSSTGVEMRWMVPGLHQTARVHFALNPLRLKRSILLADHSIFRPPDRSSAWGWAIGSLF